MPRRFPPPWTVEQIPGGYKVKDANGQALAYVYARETKADADTAKVLTMDEARRVASNIAKLPMLLGAADHSELDFPEGAASQHRLRSASNLPLLPAPFFCEHPILGLVSEPRRHIEEVMDSPAIGALDFGQNDWQAPTETGVIDVNSSGNLAPRVRADEKQHTHLSLPCRYLLRLAIT